MSGDKTQKAILEELRPALRKLKKYSFISGIVNKRRPYEDDKPEGYLEGDQDYVYNNIDLCVAFLDCLTEEEVKSKNPQLEMCLKLTEENHP